LAVTVFKTLREIGGRYVQLVEVNVGVDQGGLLHEVLDPVKLGGIAIWNIGKRTEHALSRNGIPAWAYGVANGLWRGCRNEGIAFSSAAEIGPVSRGKCRQEDYSDDGQKMERSFHGCTSTFLKFIQIVNSNLQNWFYQVSILKIYVA
jgi:hypothetical protein